MEESKPFARTYSSSGSLFTQPQLIDNLEVAGTPHGKLKGLNIH
jgi:hypothetical protein